MQLLLAGMRRSRTHPTPRGATTVLKTEERTSVHALPLNLIEPTFWRFEGGILCRHVFQNADRFPTFFPYIFCGSKPLFAE